MPGCIIGLGTGFIICWQTVVKNKSKYSSKCPRYALSCLSAVGLGWPCSKLWDTQLLHRLDVSCPFHSQLKGHQSVLDFVSGLKRNCLLLGLRDGKNQWSWPPLKPPFFLHVLFSLQLSLYAFDPLD